MLDGKDEVHLMLLTLKIKGIRFSLELGLLELMLLEYSFTNSYECNHLNSSTNLKYNYKYMNN